MALTKFASNVQQSQTTYYTIGNIKVRVSDHPARSGSCDLDILHYGRDYIVYQRYCCLENPTCSLLRTKEDQLLSLSPP